MFLGSTIAGKWGYNAAYLFGGCFMIFYGVMYAILCRAGNEHGENNQKREGELVDLDK